MILMMIESQWVLCYMRIWAAFQRLQLLSGKRESCDHPQNPSFLFLFVVGLPFTEIFQLIEIIPVIVEAGLLHGILLYL